MKKILLHLGLPKTATTTLQHHLFQRLHDEGEINFLGKVIDFDENTRRPVFRNNVGGIIRQACEGKVPLDIHEELDAILVNDKLNVYSDEGIMVYYPGQENLSLAEKINNLDVILSNYNVEVLLTLRNPVDYLFSLYVELHPDFFSLDGRLDTFEKYSINLLENRSDPLYESVYYGRLIRLISSHFDLNVTLYEDLGENPGAYYLTLARVLGVDEKRVCTCLGATHENKKLKESGGVYSVKTFSFARVGRKLKPLTMRYTILHSLLKFIHKYILPRRLVRLVLGKKNVFYPSPSTELRNGIMPVVSLSSRDTIIDQYLDRDSLIRYGYISD